MNMFKRIDAHAALVGDMAETVGIDMADALTNHQLGGSDLRGAVLRCMSCDSVEACGEWLQSHAATEADSPPAYCRNLDLLESLRN